MAQDRIFSCDLPGSLIAALEKLEAGRGGQTPSQAAQNAVLWFLSIRSAAASRDARRLTRRQLQVLELTVRGRSTKEISEQLGISVKTVETYRTQFMNTFHFKGVADAVHFAIRAGIIALHA